MYANALSACGGGLSYTSSTLSAHNDVVPLLLDLPYSQIAEFQGCAFGLKTDIAFPRLEAGAFPGQLTVAPKRDGVVMMIVMIVTVIQNFRYPKN